MTEDELNFICYRRGIEI